MSEDKPYTTVEGMSEDDAAFVWRSSTPLFVARYGRDLLIEGRTQERLRIAQWLRENSAEICDWSPPTIAAAIIDGEHWGEVK